MADVVIKQQALKLSLQQGVLTPVVVKQQALKFVVQEPSADLSFASPITVLKIATVGLGGISLGLAVAQPVGVTGTVGTSVLGSHEDHVHALPFTPVQAALALASGPISVNSKQITNLLDPTLAQDAATKAYVDSLDSGDVVNTRQVIAGTGLTGGGDLSADRTFNVIANADGSIVANANDVQVGVLATDAQHGLRGGGTQHALAVSAGAAGFMTGADKAKLDSIGPANAGTATMTFGVNQAEASVVVTGQTGLLSGSIVNAWIRLEATAQHTADEVRAEAVYCVAGTIVPTVGFTIYGQVPFGTTEGDFIVNWRWT